MHVYIRLVYLQNDWCRKYLYSKCFRRILFFVDRVSLGGQAMDTFKDVKLKELMALDKTYELKAIDDNEINTETKVSVSTVQC